MPTYGHHFIQTYEDPTTGEDAFENGHAILLSSTGSRRWELSGNPEEPFKVGLVWDPDAPAVQDRFTHEHLVATAEQFELHPLQRTSTHPQARGSSLNAPTR